MSLCRCVSSTSGKLNEMETWLGAVRREDLGNRAEGSETFTAVCYCNSKLLQYCKTKLAFATMKRLRFPNQSNHRIVPP